MIETMKNEELRELHLSPSLRQDKSLASLFNRVPGPKNGKGKDGPGRHSLLARGASNRNVSQEKRSPSSPTKISPKVQIPLSDISDPPFSPVSRRGSAASSRRGSTASTRRGSVASARRSSVDSRRGSALSHDAMLAALPQVPLNVNLRPVDDLDTSRQKCALDFSNHSARNPKQKSALDFSNHSAHSYASSSMKKKSDSLDEDSSAPRKPTSLIALGPAAALDDASSVNGEPDENIVPLSSLLPITEEATTVILKATQSSDDTRSISIQTIEGKTLATWEHSACKNLRVLRDARGKVCAFVQHFRVEGQNKYKICSDTPMNEKHPRNSSSGFYTWAEVKNVGAFGFKFGMRMRGASTDRYNTESFSPSFLNWGKQTRGFLVLKNEVACARLTYLHSAKGLHLSPGTDLGLMICYAAIIDEMVENRLR